MPEKAKVWARAMTAVTVRVLMSGTVPENGKDRGNGAPPDGTWSRHCHGRPGRQSWPARPDPGSSMAATSDHNAIGVDRRIMSSHRARIVSRGTPRPGFAPRLALRCLVCPLDAFTDGTIEGHKPMTLERRDLG